MGTNASLVKVMPQEKKEKGGVAGVLATTTAAKAAVKWKQQAQEHTFKLRSDDNKEDIREITGVDLWNGFQENTTSHGFSHFATSKGKPKKTLWIVLTFLFLGAMITHTSYIIYNYFQRKVTYNVEIKSEPELLFPAVTICNVNTLLMTQVASIPALAAILSSSNTTSSSGRRRRDTESDPDLTANFGPVPNPVLTHSSDTGRRQRRQISPGPIPRTTTTLKGSPSLTSPPTTTPKGPLPPSLTPTTTLIGPSPPTPPPTTTLKGLSPSSGSSPNSSPSSSLTLTASKNTPKTTAKSPSSSSGGKTPRQQGANQAQRWKTTMQIIEEVANYNLSTKEELSTIREDFILECVYAGYECSPSDFYQTFNNFYGNCFTFNAGWNSSLSQYITSKPGPANGLEVTLNLNQDFYISTTEVAGARVLIHDANAMPFIEDQGISVEPGTATHIGILRTSVSRLPAPYGVCLELEDKDGNYISQEWRDVFETWYPVRYSQSGCLKTCYQRNVISSCGCADSAYPLEGPALGTAVVKACSVLNDNQTDCMDNVAALYQENSLDCDCPLACNEMVYTPLVTSLRWPSDVAEQAVKQRLGGLSVSARNVLNDPDTVKYRRNFLTMTVFYQDLADEVISETPAYGDEKLFADLGGAFGLWMGASFFTMFEVIELLGDFVVLCHKKNMLRMNSR